MISSRLFAAFVILFFVKQIQSMKVMSNAGHLQACTMSCKQKNKMAHFDDVEMKCSCIKAKTLNGYRRRNLSARVLYSQRLRSPAVHKNLKI